MKNEKTANGLLLSGSLRKAGITFYIKQGQVVARPAHSEQRRSNTLQQFVQRQRLRHTVALWNTLKYCSPMFTEHRSAYNGFTSLANRLPVVYMPKSGPLSEASLLMPGIPVSDGTLPAIGQHLGQTDGTPALLTDLKVSELGGREKLLLYTAEQHLEGSTPRVRFDVREVRRDELCEVDGCAALKGDAFADTMKGWALVRVDDGRCSQQGIVTACTYYLPYTTDEALATAAKSYGGLTE